MAANWYDDVRLDRMAVLTGTLNGSDTRWTYPAQYTRLDTVVLGPDFGSNFGTMLAIDSQTLSGGNTIVQIDGTDYTAGEVVIGRSYTMRVQLTRPFARDGRGTADYDAALSLRHISAHYVHTGYLKVRVALDTPNTTDQSNTVNIDPISRSALELWCGGQVKSSSIFLENDSPKPCTVSSVEFNAQYTPQIKMEIPD